MKRSLKQINETFATTQLEAENIVSEAKDKNGSDVVNHSITRKNKKGVEYFVVKVTVQHNTEKSIVEELA